MTEDEMRKAIEEMESTEWKIKSLRFQAIIMEAYIKAMRMDK